MELDVVARNVVLLLLALTSQDPTNDSETTETNTPPDIAEALIHVWNSASIPSGVMSLLQSRVKPLFVELCSRIADKPANLSSLVQGERLASASRILCLIGKLDA